MDNSKIEITKNMNLGMVSPLEQPSNELEENVNETCDGKHPYCGERNDMETAEKNSPDKPIEFTKKQSKLHLSETQLRQMVKEAISQFIPVEDDVYTMEDWEKDGTLKVKEGQKANTLFSGLIMARANVSRDLSRVLGKAA